MTANATLPKDGGRWRRHRDRVAAGVRVLPVRVRFNEWSGALVGHGFLDERDCDDPSKVAEATERLIELWLQTGL
jgi:hypothetical protein